jgi:Mn2+/Fe2+ NRAMP family transporter
MKAQRKKKATSARTGDDGGFLKRLGPCLITGASDDDPSGIGAYSQAGAQLGLGVSRTMLLTYPLVETPFIPKVSNDNPQVAKGSI